MKLGGMHALCVTLLSNQTGKPLVGILKIEKETRPVYVDLDRTLRCSSHGTAWVLEPVWGDESYPANNSADLQKAVWIDGETGVLIFGKPSSDSTFDDTEADLIGSGLVNKTNSSIPAKHWRIWASEADRNRPGASPLVEFGAPEGTSTE